MPARLSPLETPTPDALLTGDPRRAFALAAGLMVQPRMSHQSRGLWGYTGFTPDGAAITVQATGSGGSSAATVIGDLAALGVRRVVRLGSCVGGETLAPGSCLLVNEAISRDGVSGALTSKAAGHEPVVIRPDPVLLDGLVAIGRPVTISSHDLVARFDPDGPLPDDRAEARDLQTAPTFAMADRIGMQAAAILIVAADVNGRTLEEADLTDRCLEVGLKVVEYFARTEAVPKGDQA